MREQGTKFATADIRGRKIDLLVDSSGKFYADWDGQFVYGDTKDALIQKLTGITKVVISIPFDRWENETLKHGTITGLHGANGNILIKWDDGKTEQESYWGHSTAGYLTLDAASRARYAELQLTRANLEEQIDAFEKAHSFNPSTAAKKAIEAAQKAKVPA